MTENRQKKFEDSLSQEDKKLYSANFLLARFTPVDAAQHEEQILQHKLPSRHYQSRDFAVVRFGKSISTPLSRFLPIEGEDE